MTAIVAIAALAMVGLAFTANASPYIETIAEARKSQDDRLHLAGDIVKSSVNQDFKTGHIRFRLRDARGETIEVLHRGDPPANMGEATKVVVIGGVKGDRFESSKMLIKCPSKYEGEQKPSKVAKG